MLFEPFQLQLPEGFREGVECDEYREPEPLCNCGHPASMHTTFWYTWETGLLPNHITWNPCVCNDSCTGFWLNTMPESMRVVAWPKHEWEWTLNGCRDIVFCVQSAPNAFHRLMQRLVLGIHWSRAPKS